MNDDADFMALADSLWEANKTGPHSAYVNSGAFLPLPVLTENHTSIVEEILAQDPKDLLPEGLDPTIYAGYAAKLKVLAAQYNGTTAALLEIPFSGRSGFSLVNLKELSRGSVHISPEDDGAGRGDAEPVVDYRTLVNPVDNRVNAIFVSFIRRFFASDALVEALNPVEVSPGAEDYPDGSDELDGWLRQVLTPSTGHPVGTCSLGPIELGGVVGADLTVYGTRGLSVADNSVIPILPGTHTSSTAYAIGEKVSLSGFFGWDVMLTVVGCRSGEAEGRVGRCRGGGAGGGSTGRGGTGGGTGRRTRRRTGRRTGRRTRRTGARRSRQTPGRVLGDSKHVSSE